MGYRISDVKDISEIKHAVGAVNQRAAVINETDGTVLVCRHNVSYVSDVSRALSTLQFAKANVLGIVVNDYKAPATGKIYGGYKKYYYYNSYGYGYGSTNPNDKDEDEPVKE